MQMKCNVSKKFSSKVLMGMVNISSKLHTTLENMYFSLSIRIPKLFWERMILVLKKRLNPCCTLTGKRGQLRR